MNVSSGCLVPFKAQTRERANLRLGPGVGLQQLAVNIVELPPRTWSSQRPRHRREERSICMLHGEAFLIRNDGEQVLMAGVAAGFLAYIPEVNHLMNRASDVAVVLAMSTRYGRDEAI